MTDPGAEVVRGEAPLTPYEAKVWKSLNDHWSKRDNQRGLPNWASGAIDRTQALAKKSAKKAAEKVPDGAKEQLRKAADIAVDKAAEPALNAALGLLNLVNDWAVELNDPQAVEKLARKKGLEINSFEELREKDLKDCDRLLTANTLKWRTGGALEGGAMGALALVPVAGTLTSLTADLLVVQVLSVSIATRVAYSYGFDAKNPEEQEFIQRLVNRSFTAQAAKAVPLRDTMRAVDAIQNRVRWSEKLLNDHRIIAAVEKLVRHLGPAATRAPIQSVAKALPYVGIVVGAGANSVILGNVAADAKRFCQTRFLCEKYDLPLPTALRAD